MINEVISTFREIDEKDTLLILGYELGDLFKSIASSNRFPKDKDLYLLYARTAVSDLLVQLRSLCEIHGWDFIELMSEGVERLEDRAAERIKDREKGEYQGH